MKPQTKPKKSQNKPVRAPRPPAALKPAEVVAFFDRLAAANPNPRGELEFINPYTLLVAVVLRPGGGLRSAEVSSLTNPL